MWKAARRCCLTTQVATCSRKLQTCYLATATTSTDNKQNIEHPRKKQKKSELLRAKTTTVLQNTLPWTNAEWNIADDALHAWTRQPKISYESVISSFRLLDRMVQEAQKEPNFVIKTKHLNYVLDRWRIGSRYNVLDRNDKLSAPKVLALIDDYKNRIPSLYINQKSYAMIMAVYIKQNAKDSPKFCSEMLSRMEERPNTVVLTHVMDAHFKSGQPNAAPAIQSIFDYMIESDDPLMAPDEKSLTRVLQAWIMSGSDPDQACPKMQSAIDFLLQSTSKGKQKALRDSVFLNIVLLSCLEGSRGGNPPVKVTLLADDLMTLVVEKSKQRPQLAPDSSAFSSIISLWTKTSSPDAPKRAEHWLNEMIQASKLYPNLVTPPRGSLYTTVISAWEKSGLPDAPFHGEALWQRMIKESTITSGAYYLLISLWSKSNLSEAPTKALDLLKQMIAASKSDSRLRPSCPAFGNVISCWRKSNLAEAPYKAQETLDLLLEEYQKRPDLVQINDTPFNATIHTWAKSGLPEAESKGEEILNYMKKEAEKNPSFTPSIVTAWSVMQCLSSEDAPFKATRLLELMENEARNKNSGLRGQLYKEVLRLWGESHYKNAAHNAEEIFRQYQSEPKKNRQLDTTMRCYELVSLAWKNSSLPKALEMSECFLKEMTGEAERICMQNSDPRPFSLVAEAWARSSFPHASEQVEDNLEKMLRECRAMQNSPPKSSWFNGIISAYVESRNVEKAEALLQRIIRDYHQEWDTVAPTTEMYTAIINGLLALDGSNATDRAKGFLEGIIDLYSSGRITVQPSVQCFGLIMNAYSKEKNHAMVEQLWDLLQELQSMSNQNLDLQPDATVVTSIPRISGRVAKEDAVLLNLVDQARQTKENIPDITLFHNVLDSLVNSGDSNAGKRAEVILLKMQELFEEGCLAKPTFQTFQKVIDCWVTSGVDGAAKRAEEILELADDLSKAGDKQLEPSFEGYMSVIKGWSRSHTLDAPDRIQNHLRKMRGTFGKLDDRAYTSLIEAYANSGRDDAALMSQAVFDATPDECKSTDLYNALIAAQGAGSNRAEVILHRMHKEYLAGNDRIKPNTASFNNVLLSWSRSGSAMAAWRADGIFQRMTELARTGELDVKPNGTTFDIVIATISNDWGADAATKVDHYLELLKDHYRSGDPDCVPSVTSYTEAIRAWGSNIDDPRAVLRAKALLDEMHEMAREGAVSVKPDRGTYLVYLKALLQSPVESREELARDVLLLMKRDDIDLDGAILSQIQRCSLPVDLVPSTWTVQLVDSSQSPDTTPAALVDTFP